MAQFIVTSPDGQKFKINAPEGATQEQALSYAQQQFAQRGPSLKQTNPEEYDPASPEYKKKYGPAAVPFFDNFWAGAGKAVVDTGRGLAQIYGHAADAVAPRQRNLSDIITGRDPSRSAEIQQSIDESAARDAPLNHTVGGVTGNIAGNAAMWAIPTGGLVKGATLPVRALKSAGLGAAIANTQPVTTGQSRLQKTVLGAAGGAAGEALATGVGAAANWASNKLASRAAAAQADESLNSARDAILGQAREAGYVVPPTAANPNLASTALESYSGKAATRQAAAVKNARVTNELVRQDLAIPANQPITREALESVIRREGRVYAQVKSSGPMTADAQYLDDLQAVLTVGNDLESAYPGIGAQANEKVQQLVQAISSKEHTAENAVSLFKLLNERAKENFKAAFSGGDSQALELARAQSAAADAVGGLIERNLQANGQQGLASAWQNARVTIAKAYQAQSALQGNNISAAALARQLRKGKPLSGGMGLAARFADQFGDVAGIPKSGVGVSKLEAFVGTGGIGAGFLAGGAPGAVAAAGAAATPYGTRQALLSGVGQRLLATPNYGPGVVGNGALNALVAAPPYANALLPVLGATGAIAAQ